MADKKESVAAHEHADLKREIASLKREVAALKKQLSSAPKSSGKDPRIDALWSYFGSNQKIKKLLK